MRFKRIYIEISNVCNLKCDFCIQNSRENKIMSVEEFEYILKQIDDYSEYLYLHVLGEPLLHPHLKEILELCSKYHKKVMITTNATLLKKQLTILCCDCVKQVNLSIHSFPYHMQQAYLQDIYECAKRLASYHIHVNYRLWSIKENELDEIAKKLLNDILKQYDKQLDHVQRLQRFDLSNYIHMHFEEVFTWPTLSNDYVGDQGTCLGLKQMIAILSDGSVVPCCLDSKKEACLGNIFQTSFLEIIHSDLVKQTLNNFKNHKITLELCKHCSYRLRFSKSIK